MGMTKKMIIEKTQKVGTHFAQSFPISEGVAINSRFTINGREWIVGRIDNVVCANGRLHVEGYCIPADIE